MPQTALMAQTITPTNLLHSINWAQQLPADAFVFTDWANDAIFAVSKRLYEKYGAAHDIPLVSPHMEQKIVRLATAYAIFRHSTEDHKKVNVTAEHVLFIENLLDRIYSGPDFKLDEYAALKKGPTITAEKFNEIYERLMTKTGSRHYVDKTVILIDLIAENSSPSLQMVTEKLGMGRDAVIDRIGILKAYSLVTTNPTGYHPGPLFHQFYRLWKEKMAEADQSV